MFSYSSTPTLTNCWFSRNTSNYRGGGMYSEDSDSTLTNCIFWGNSAPSGTQLYVTGGTASVTYSCIEGGWAGTGNISGDPLCVDPDGADDIAGTEDDNLRLRPGSPCIDAGNNEADIDANSSGVQPLPDTDLDGNPRFVDDPATPDDGAGVPPIVDLGAYEYTPGDVDGDGDADLNDYAVFAECLAGPDETTPPGGCTQEQFDKTDLDADDDVDLGDFAVFQRGFTANASP